MNRRSLIALGLATALARFFPIPSPRSPRPFLRGGFIGVSSDWSYVGEARSEVIPPLGPMQAAIREAQAGWTIEP